MKKLWPALALTLSCTALMPAEAQATAWEAKTMRAPLSAREVERPLILGKGWLELSLEAQVKNTNQYWGPEGEKLEWDYAEWLYTKETLRVRYGILRRGDLTWELPVHYLRLQNENLGTDTKGMYWGDPRFSFTFEPLRTDVPLTSIVTKAEMKVPMGNESPGSYIAGPSTFQRFITTSGTPDLTLSARGKRQIGIFAVEAGVGYMYRFSGLAQYLLETTNNQLNGRLKPGNQIQLDAAGMVQLGPVALQGGLWLKRWGTVEAGTTSGGLLPNGNLEPIVGSEGWGWGADINAIGHVTRGIDVVAGAYIPVRGEDLMFFPIEDLHPTRGTTFTGRLEFRF
jgi:hypothetical protein